MIVGRIGPVDEILPWPRLLTLRLQHVLVMKAGMVAMPLIVGHALGLPHEGVAFLIGNDLLADGVATLIRTARLPGVGIRLPAMMGATFASVSPMLAVAPNAEVGLLGICGQVIAAFVLAVILPLHFGRPVDERALPCGPRADGVGTQLGGILCAFPYTSFSQKVGLVGETGVRSRWACVADGLTCWRSASCRRWRRWSRRSPWSCCRGAGIAELGMVAAKGVGILQAVDFGGNRHDLLIVAVSIGLGMIPLVAPNVFKHLPHGLHPLLESGILLAAIAAVTLNAFL